MPKQSTKEASLAIIRKHMKLHNLAVVTECSSYKQEELLCDPIIWVDSDIENRCTMEQWENLGRAGRTLHERSTEEGWEIIASILGNAEDDEDDDDAEEEEQ